MIRIEEKPSKKLHLLFKDNGVGLPDSIEIKNVDSLGLRLVRVLTQQLKGKLKLEREEKEVLEAGVEVLPRPKLLDKLEVGMVQDGIYPEEPLVHVFNRLNKSKSE